MSHIENEAQAQSRAREVIIDAITDVAIRTKTFGGGNPGWSPISSALKDSPLQFAMGVEVREVVELVFQGLQDMSSALKPL